MYSFRSDYSEGAHPRILEALTLTNMEQTDGYGEDPHCENAIAMIKKAMGTEKPDVHLMVGGTQTNFTAIAAFLRPHQAVIASKSGHIYVHETGAVEATGHKVIPIPTEEGKLLPEQIVQCLVEHEDEHMVMPKLVYISNSAEIGPIYTKAELVALRKVCDENGLYLYMDGARLASALTCQRNDLTLEDLPRLLDAFYIGGTKNGALFGEALVICNDSLKADFRYHIKQKGGLLAKGRLLGIQFEALFKDDLYFQLGTHANRMATLLREEIEKCSYKFFTDSPSNQIFPIFPNELIKELEKDYGFYIWNKISPEESTIRLVTSWATEEKYIHEFIEKIKK